VLELQIENAALRRQLAQADDTVRAIRAGEVDALFVASASGQRLFPLDGADRAYRQLVEEMGEGALTLSSAGVVLYANQRFAEMLGRRLPRVVGSHIGTWVAPEGQDSLATLFAAGTYSKRTAEVDLLALGGARVPTFLSASRLVVDGLPDAVCMVATDLSWRRRSEAEAQAREALLSVIEQQRATEESLRISMSTLRLHDSALGAISQGVVIADRQGHTTYANGACEDISGYTAAEMAGRTTALLQGPGTSAAVAGSLRAAIRDALPFHGELLNYRKDGTPFRNELSVTPVFGADGTPTHFVGVMRDVTARWEADAQLLLAAKVFEQSSEGFMITDAEGHIVKVNPAFTTICGYSEAEALGQNPRMLGSGRHDAAFFHALWAEIHSQGRWQGEVWNRRKDGQIYPQWLSIGRVADGTGRTTHYIASFSDITQRKEAEDSIRRLAHYDALTGLPNRALLQDRALHALKLAHRSGEPLALMFIDLDHFKNVNDSLGHAIGDRLLEGLAARFTATLRDQDTLSRMGGDEFVLLLPGTDATGAAHVAQKLLLATRQPFQIDHHELTITPSIGIAVYPLDGDDFGALAKCADAAMYRAKQGGRNTFCFYTTEIQAQSARVLLLENGLRRAVERDQLQLHYQPQRSLRDGSIVGAEALLRWHHPELGWVPPSEFIPIAESSGLIVAIGEWVMRTALWQMKAWLDDGMAPMTLAVNLSTVQFRQQKLPDMVSRLLEETGVAPETLELELTESVASDDPAGAVEVMNRLRECGVRMSIDDFGTGYSSLSYLKRFKVYKLKIDRSFICSLTDAPEDQAIVTAIISLAGILGLRTIAEGVETLAQMELLRSKGCDEMQGYLFSPPLPPPQFRAFVAAAARREFQPTVF
jgi:diguanylate cyclase (GGDEF)-like protein/PAS domain S-box-containing protein